MFVSIVTVIWHTNNGVELPRALCNGHVHGNKSGAEH